MRPNSSPFVPCHATHNFRTFLPFLDTSAFSLGRTDKDEWEHLMYVYSQLLSPLSAWAYFLFESSSKAIEKESPERKALQSFKSNPSYDEEFPLH